LPAKSGKKASSSEKLTKLSRTGAPAAESPGIDTPLKPAGVPSMGSFTGISVVCAELSTGHRPKARLREMRGVGGIVGDHRELEKHSSRVEQ
jgi:hypothetical protein